MKKDSAFIFGIIIFLVAVFIFVITRPFKNDNDDLDSPEYFKIDDRSSFDNRNANISNQPNSSQQQNTNIFGNTNNLLNSFMSKKNELDTSLDNMKKGTPFYLSDEVIEVNSDSVLLTSYENLKFSDSRLFKYDKLTIKFVDQIGSDNGGLTREWLKLIMEEMLNPMAGFFTYVSDNNARVIPSKVILGDIYETDIYKLLGRILGYTIIKKTPVNVYFDRIIFKHILEIPCTEKDYEDADPALYTSINNLRDDPGDGNYFTNLYGEDIIKNGSEIRVTKDNVEKYIKEFFRFTYVTAIEQQCNLIKTGFYEVIDKSFLKNWTAEELELLICGERTIDVEIWKNKTVYKNYTKTDNVIIWFWEVVKNFNEDDKIKLLEFITAFSRFPIGGFENPFKDDNPDNLFEKDTIMVISKSHASPTNLPGSHTCIRYLDLPVYKSKKELETKIIQAINFANRGFECV